MTENKKKELAIIVPVYKAQNTLSRSLASIAMQTAVDALTVYLVLDGETAGEYQSILNHFRPLIDINVIETPTNEGPGAARQKGLDASDHPFFMFMDSDDTFATAHACKEMLTLIKEPAQRETVILMGNMQQQNADGTFEIVGNNMVWLNSKIYRKSFIDKYNIRFANSYIGEDVGFLRLCQIYANEQNEKIGMVNQTIYDWHYNNQSITRDNLDKSRYFKTPEGVRTTIEYVIRRLYKEKKLNRIAHRYFVAVFSNLYLTYNAALGHNKHEYLKHILDSAKKVYNLAQLLDMKILREVEIEEVSRAIVSDPYLTKEKGIIWLSYDEFKNRVIDFTHM